MPAAALDLDTLLTDRLGEHLEQAGDAIVDVLVGNDDEFWHLRHSISESLRGDGKLLAFDVSVPRSSLPAFTDDVSQLLARDYADVQLCDYGHWADGGTHLNLVWDEARPDSAARVAALQDAIYELAVVGYGGSYSAEHGVGPHNQRFYDRFTDPTVKSLCRAVQDFCSPTRRSRHRAVDVALPRWWCLPRSTGLEAALQ